MNNKGKRRSKNQLARDRKRIGDYYLKGWLQADIADELDISQATVSRDIKALQKAWLDSALVDFNEAKARELAKVDQLEREYWQAWERSCEDAEMVKQKGQPTQEPGKVTTSSVEKTIKGQVGDPRFLTGIQWCINKRCEILGIDAPKRHELQMEGTFELKDADPKDTLLGRLDSIAAREAEAGGGQQPDG